MTANTANGLQADLTKVEHVRVIVKLHTPTKTHKEEPSAQPEAQYYARIAGCKTSSLRPCHPICKAVSNVLPPHPIWP